VKKITGLVDLSSISRDVKDTLGARIRAGAAGGKLPCPVALDLALEFKVPARVVGALANELGVRIGGCQLGCF